MTYISSHKSFVFGNVLKKVVRDPMLMHYDLYATGKNITLIDDRSRMTANDLAGLGYCSINAVCSPCLIMAKVIKDHEGELVEASAAHFSANVTSSQIDHFLQASSADSENTFVAMAGLAQMEDRTSLREKTSRVVDRLHRFGIPISLTMDRDQRPIIIDERQEQVISDIGMGIISEQESVHRWVALLTTGRHSVLVSTVTTGNHQIKHTQLITDFGETVLIRPGK